jgi:hypothetical protein
MALQLHVNGPAEIQIDAGGGLEQLGFSVDGVSISFNMLQEDVFVDCYGPKMPYDVQYFLQSINVKCDLILHDNDVLNEILAGIADPTGNAGIVGAAGDLYIQNVHYHRLLIKSIPDNTGLTDVEPCHNFPVAMLTDVATGNFGTRRTQYALTWLVLLPQQTTSIGAVLYDNTCD